MKPCQDRCENFSFQMKASSSVFPDEHAFQLRSDFCYVMKKIIKNCKNEWKRERMLAWIQTRYLENFTCENLFAIQTSSNLCLNTTMPDFETLKENTDIFKVVYGYAKDNIAYMKFFIEKPFYTRSIRDIPMTGSAFVGNTGGLISLCMGLSFISIFEIVY